ncbi:hypothetical protein [Trinickia sp. LjRoot230]|uniref:hypothetical protein n=1 Tax=Trinickia sp. LjRoot230 TaxID=3342288 RepID=UPI003F50B11D
MRASPHISPEDKATLLEAIVSDPVYLHSLPRGMIEKIFDRIRVLPERYQFGLLSLLLRNADVFSKTHQASVIQLRERVVGAVRALAHKPDATIPPARAVPQLGLLEIAESLFGGVENRVDRLSPQSGSSAAAADRLAALASAAPATFELVEHEDQSKDLVKALSTSVLDRILALEEPRHRFSALLELVSAPRDNPAFVEALAGQPLPNKGDVLDFGAFTRIIDAIPGLPSRYRAALLEAMLPQCLYAGNMDETAIIVNRVVALLLDVIGEDCVPPLQKLVSGRPLVFAKRSERLPIARAIRRVIFVQGSTVPPQLLADFVTKVVADLSLSHQYDPMNQMVQFVRESPRELRSARAKALLSSNAMPSHMEAKLRSMARD